MSRSLDRLVTLGTLLVAGGAIAAPPTEPSVPRSPGVAVAPRLVGASASGGLFAFRDDFDGYAPGSVLAGQGGWEPWLGDGSVGNAEITPVSLDAPHGVAIDGTDDLVQPFSGVEIGSWIVVAHQFVPEDATGESHFILMNQYVSDGSSLNWSLDLVMDSDLGVVRDFNEPGTSVPLRRGTWVPVKAVVDLDADHLRVWYGEEIVVDRSWSDGFGQSGAVELAAIDLFCNGGSVVFYDDLIVSPYPVYNATVDTWHPTIQSGVEDGFAGNEIVVYPGHYVENVTIADPIHLRGSSGNPADVVIDGDEFGSVMAIYGLAGDGTRVDGFTLRNGFWPQGGGLRIETPGRQEIDRCIIVLNQADIGGGIWIDGGSSCVVDRSLVRGNLAALGAGAAVNGGGGTPTFSFTEFSDNRCDLGGGAVHTSPGSWLHVGGCVVQENFNDAPPESGGGPGPAILAEGFLILDNALVRANVGGPAVRVNDAIVTNCTFDGNDGDLSLPFEASLTLSNCILRNHGPDGAISGFLAGAVVNHSNVEGGWSGAGAFNIDADPLYADAPAGNYRLLDGSPCIDAGDLRAPETGFLDLDRGNRRQNCQVDMGCHESDLFADCNGNGEPDACELDAIVDGRFDEGGTHWRTENTGSVPGVVAFAPGLYAEVAGPDQILTPAGGGGPGTTAIVPLPESFYGTRLDFTLLGYDSADAECGAGGSYDYPVLLLNGQLHALNHDGSVTPAIADPGDCALAGTITNDDGVAVPIAFSVDLVALAGPADPGGYAIGLGVHSVDSCCGAGVAQYADVSSGDEDANGDGIPDACTCPGDIDGSGDVGFGDVVSLLASWGPCPGCPADLDGDDVVGFTDLVTVLAAWGPC